MKHINLSKPLKNGLAKYMVTQESNNFGDQILSLKEYYKNKNESGYKIIAITSRTEGDWMNIKEMKNWLKNTKVS